MYLWLQSAPLLTVPNVTDHLLRAMQCTNHHCFIVNPIRQLVQAQQSTDRVWLERSGFLLVRYNDTRSSYIQ